MDATNTSYDSEHEIVKEVSLVPDAYYYPWAVSPVKKVEEAKRSIRHNALPHLKLQDVNAKLELERLQIQVSSLRTLLTRSYPKCNESIQPSSMKTHQKKLNLIQQRPR
jgi:aspartyl/asparaginyl beta-hydroxylase (cupin superfamily)